MAEGDGVLYNWFKKKLAVGQIDLDGDLLRMTFLTSYTPNKDTDKYWADISADECSGTGYTAGGATLTSVAVTVDTANDRAEVDGGDITWTALDLTAGQPNYAVLYDDTHASNILIAYIEISTLTNGGDYALQFNADGLIWLT